MVEIFINNATHTFSQEIDLVEMLKQLSLSSQGVAIAINDTVIPKSEWQVHTLKNQDKITLIQATQGG